MNSATPTLVILVARVVGACAAAHDEMNGDDTVAATFETYDESAVTVESVATTHHERMIAMAAGDRLADAELDYQAKMRTMMDRFDAAWGDLGQCAMQAEVADDSAAMPHDMGAMNAAAAPIRAEMVHHDAMMGGAAGAAAVEREETRHLISDNYFCR